MGRPVTCGGRLVSALFALALCNGAAYAQSSPGSSPPAAASARAVREVRRVRAPEARQAVAADSAFLYAIDNRRIAKYEKHSGRRVAVWEGAADGPIHHLNSGVVLEGRLYAAHSNYPGLPMVSSIEIWDVETMRHIGSHALGIHAGSATWVDRAHGAWWILFANYENTAGEPGRGVEYTVLERFDDAWRRTGGWSLPAALVSRLRPYSSSGGFWASDDRLYLTGHEAGEIYVLRLPSAGAVLELVEVVAGTHRGQGIARDPADPALVYGIDRPRGEIVVMDVSRVLP